MSLCFPCSDPMILKNRLSSSLESPIPAVNGWQTITGHVLRNKRQFFPPLRRVPRFEDRRYLPWSKTCSPTTWTERRPRNPGQCGQTASVAETGRRCVVRRARRRRRTAAAAAFRGVSSAKSDITTNRTEPRTRVRNPIDFGIFFLSLSL